MTLSLVITNAGRAAITTAQSNGTNAITIAKVGVTASVFTPLATQTALPGEIKQLTATSGGAIAPATIHLSAIDASTDVYDLHGFGLYLADNTLFAIYSQAAVIQSKAAGAQALLSGDIVFSDLGAVSVTVGDTTFLNPPATTEVQGVVELATNAEATTGTDTTRAVTPAGVAAAITARGATAAAPGIVELATNAETTTGTDTTRAVTPAGVAAAISARTASDTVQGIVELATSAEAVTGTDTVRAVTPAGLAAAITARTATAVAAGIVELATPAEAVTGTDNVRAVTPAGLAAAISDAAPAAASATASGLVELATNAETIAGTDALRAVTPAALAAKVASATASGIVELATPAEAVTGTDTVRAVTPAGLAAAIADAAPPASSATVAGLIELATNAETIAGTDALRAVTPAALKAALLALLLTVDGSGSSVDADLLDGQHGAYYADIAARLGFTPLNAASYTAADVLAKFKTVDGSGSATDADLLDGQHGAYYADIAARLGFTPLNAASYTAADVLAKLKTVDGSGSGVDADLLDGTQLAALVQKANIMTDFGAAMSLTWGGAFGANSFYLGGLLVQTGIASTIAANGSTVVNFPIHFSASPFVVPVRRTSGAVQNADSGAGVEGTPSISSVTLRNTTAGAVIDIMWIAIGPA